MRYICSFGVLACALVFSLVAVPGCTRGDVAQSDPNREFPSDLNGEWGSKIRAPSACPMPGFLTDVQSFEITQDGDMISVSFDDTAGNQVTIAGTYVDGTLEGTLTVTSPSDRVVVADLVVYGAFAEDDLPMMDGDATVTQDTDGLCVGAVVVIWMVQSPPEDEPEPDPAPDPEPLIVFVGHGHDEDVDVVDLDSMTLIDTIENAGGYRMAILPDGTKLYGTTGDNTFTVSHALDFKLLYAIDPSDEFTQFSISELEPITVSRDGAFVYVADEFGDHGVFTVRTSDDMVIDGEVLVDANEPESATTSPDGQFLYIVDSDRAMKINTATLMIVASAPVDSDAHGVTLSDDGAFLYADGEEGGIDVIRTSDMTVVMNVAGARGYALKTSPDGKRVYAVDEFRTLYVIEVTETNEHFLESVNLDELGLPASITDARGLATTPDSKYILVCSGGNGTTSGGLIKLVAATLMPAEPGFLVGDYQSAVVRPPVGTLEPTNR